MDNAEAVLCTLGLSVEARDPYTEGHCERLSRYASVLGEHLGLRGEPILALKRGGYLHDLGKIRIPDLILKKGDKLTHEEWVIMKQHPLTGEAICKPLRSLKLVLPIIRHHHEHWNGGGYPDGLKGNEIPQLARILQVVMSTMPCAPPAPTNRHSPWKKLLAPWQKRPAMGCGTRSWSPSPSSCWRSSARWREKHSAFGTQH